MTDWLGLAICIAATALAAVTGSLFAPGDWYRALRKPAWTPPPWAFPLVWTPLYFMIALAGWWAWNAEGLSALMLVWVVQLVFNAAWSWIMFGRHRIGWAFADIVALWLSIAAFMALAWPVARGAAWLFVPYLVWVTLAAALNLRVWQLNNGVGAQPGRT